MSQNKSTPIDTNNIRFHGKYAFTLEQVSKLCEMQDELNTYIHPDWQSQGFDWRVAIQDEIMEIRGHLGWKWWKDSYQQGVAEENLPQLKLEMIDLLHFILSIEIEFGTTPDDIHDNINSGYIPLTSKFALGCDNLMECVVNTSDYLFEIWADMARELGLTEQEIMETYVQKFTLNKFRQDHGYKDGTYCKHWELRVFNSGVPGDSTSETLEDNEVLTRVVNWIKRQPNGDASDEQALYKGLSLEYNNRLNQTIG